VGEGVGVMGREEEVARVRRQPEGRIDESEEPLVDLLIPGARAVLGRLRGLRSSDTPGPRAGCGKAAPGALIEDGD